MTWRSSLGWVTSIKAIEEKDMTGFIGKIEALCSACELVYDQTHENSVRMMFEMDDDRSQMVIINGVETNDGNEVVTIQSAVLKLEGLPNQMLGGDMAKKLLRENSQMALAKWSIDETQDGKYLVATSNWYLETLDAEEFYRAVRVVAGAADEMESTLGVDNF